LQSDITDTAARSDEADPWESMAAQVPAPLSALATAGRCKQLAAG
jgi:hypothetical protein